MKISKLQSYWLLIHGGLEPNDIIEENGKMFVAMQFGRVEKYVEVPTDEYINKFYTFSKDVYGYIHSE